MKERENSFCCEFVENHTNNKLDVCSKW